MGLLVEGKWVDQWYETKSTGGKFVRQESSFRDFIGSDKFPAENGRYHLYISHACPWAHRATIFRKLKSLEDIIGITAVAAYMGENGWHLTQDPINNKTYMHEIYTMAEPKYTGRVTVPVIWDKKHNTIVNNESSEIIRMFNSAFDNITGNKNDYYPKHLENEIDSTNDYVYSNINNGVYKVGFATEQSVYDEEVIKLFSALDTIEQRLSQQRYLVGNMLTEADIRLFTTLLRFDTVYFGHFKCNIKRITDYQNLSNYIRDIYQTGEIASTVDMRHIKEHYYQSHKTINPTGITPMGPKIDYAAPHNRNNLLKQKLAI